MHFEILRMYFYKKRKKLVPDTDSFSSSRNNPETDVVAELHSFESGGEEAGNNECLSDAEMDNLPKKGRR